MLFRSMLREFGPPVSKATPVEKIEKRGRPRIRTAEYWRAYYTRKQREWRAAHPRKQSTWEQKSRNGKCGRRRRTPLQTRPGASHPGPLCVAASLSRRDAAVSCALTALKSALVAGANTKAASQIEKPGCVANALSITRFPRWRARSRKAEVVRTPAA